MPYHCATMVDGNPMIEKGFSAVPESPGLGIELNEEVIKEQQVDGKLSQSGKEKLQKYFSIF